MSNEQNPFMAQTRFRSVGSRPVLGEAIPRRWGWFTRTAARTLMTLAGWRIDGWVPNAPKLLLIGAPHTSNFDYLLTLLTAMSLGVDLHYVAKRQLFDHPLGGFFRWLGGVRLDRQQSNGFVEQMAGEFERREAFLLALMPEGTRSRTSGWRTGFYYIARQADVPITLVTFDYGARLMLLGPSLRPTGNLEADLAAIRSHFDGIQGRHPQ